MDNKGNMNKAAQFYKSDKDVPLSSNSKTASAALARFDQHKNNKVINQKDRKQRTMQLMHGDLLKDQDEVKAQPRQSAYYDDDVVKIESHIYTLSVCARMTYHIFLVFYKQMYRILRWLWYIKVY